MGRSLLTIGTLIGALLYGSAIAVELPSPLRQPNWSELTAQQKQTLAPLASEWDSMEIFRRKKWLGIAERYPAMSAEEQERMQRRMHDWAQLSPAERKAARAQYKTLKQEPPEKRAVVKQKWEEYKELPEEEKKRLQEASKPRPVPKPGRPLVNTPITAPITKASLKPPVVPQPVPAAPTTGPIPLATPAAGASAPQP